MDASDNGSKSMIEIRIRDYERGQSPTISVRRKGEERQKAPLRISYAELKALRGCENGDLLGATVAAMRGVEAGKRA